MNGLRFSRKVSALDSVLQNYQYMYTLHVWANYKISDFTMCQTQVVVDL